MKQTDFLVTPRRRLWPCTLPALLVTVLLAGCATGTGLSSAADAESTTSTRSDAPRNAGNDIVTESDEPAVRKRARIRLALAIGYLEQGQTTIALDEVKQALAIDPEFADAYNMRGLVYMRLNDQQLAEESFRRAVALNPRDGSILHNQGWLMCEQKRYPQAAEAFAKAMANPNYGNRSRTLMARGLCEERAGQPAEAERSLTQSYELDAGNPVTGYNLARLLYNRGDNERARFYIRRLNNSELANAESLWLGVRVERRLENKEAMLQLASQLQRRYPQAPELGAYERGEFK